MHQCDFSSMIISGGQNGKIKVVQCYVVYLYWVLRLVSFNSREGFDLKVWSQLGFTETRRVK